ncbi:MAG: long-chain fatty acid--CoA ligase [Acidobacteria bacterium]|nr:long-chain fatty acid--CoA ligase [Acidobacteriota bacterium]
MTISLETGIHSPRRNSGRGLPLFPDEPRTLSGLFEYAAAKKTRPDALRYRTAEGWVAISSEQVLERAGNIALGLYSLGLRKGERAAILAANSPAWTLSDAGCQFAGVIDVPIYTTLSPASVEYILIDSGAKALFIDSAEAFERIAEVLSNCLELEHIIFFDPAAAEKHSALDLQRLEKSGGELRADEPELLSKIGAEADPEDVATLIYTSGTTGEPKGVMLTHSCIVSNVIDAGEKYSFSPTDACLSVLPLSHIFERSAMYLYIFNGMCVNYAESIEKVPENLAEVRPNILVGVPRIFEKVYAKAKLKAAESGGLKEKIFDWAIAVGKEYALLSEGDANVPFSLKLKHSLADRLVFSKLRDFFGGRLRFCITGGAALSDDIYLIFNGAGISIMQGYGLTETSPVITSSNPFDVRLGKVGKPIRNFQVRIAEDGEIEATGPGVMLGYYKKEQATREAFTDDGWFRTGDIGEIDEDGFLRITDRKKELFKTSGGKYIAPSPIEQMLKTSKFVSQAVLIGSERKFAAALIVPNFDMLVSYAKHKGLEISGPEEFVKHPKILDLFERQIAATTKDLARFETVKKFTLLTEEFTVEGGEMTPTLKVKRRVIDEKYAEVIEKLYEED